MHLIWRKYDGIYDDKLIYTKDGIYIHNRISYRYDPWVSEKSEVTNEIGAYTLLLSWGKSVEEIEKLLKCQT